MSQAMPPVGERAHLQAREAVLEAVREFGPCRIPDIDAHLGDRATVLTHWHLLILGDLGQVEWVRGPGDDHVRTYVQAVAS